MTRRDHLLVILMEECAEVAQRASKALRFGLDEIEPDQEEEETNAQRLSREFADLRAAWELLLDDCAVSDGPMNVRVQRKKTKVEKFLLYSREQGRLS